MLLPAGGLVGKTLFSIKALVALPHATLSTIVPVFSAPFLNATPLSAAIVAEVVESGVTPGVQLPLAHKKYPNAGIIVSPVNDLIEESVTPADDLLTNLVPFRFIEEDDGLYNSIKSSLVAVPAICIWEITTWLAAAFIDEKWDIETNASTVRRNIPKSQ